MCGVVIVAAVVSSIFAFIFSSAIDVFSGGVVAVAAVTTVAAATVAVAVAC